MPTVPYPLSARDLDELKTQIYEVVRQLYEDHIGGADLGDVFAIVGDVLTLVLASTGGLTKVSNELALLLQSAGGLNSTADGLTIKLADGSLSLSASGLAASATTKDHGSLTGLADDDHTQYLLVDGTRGLTGNWDAGSFEIRAQTFESDVSTGTAPFTVASTTVVTNLNADQVDGYDLTQIQTDATDAAILWAIVLG